MYPPFQEGTTFLLSFLKVFLPLASSVTGKWCFLQVL